MADLSTIRTTFDTHLNDNWNTNDALVAWDATKFTTPDSGVWIRPMLTFNFSENATVGDSRVRHDGDYIVQIFSPLNQGLGDNYAVADLLIKLFQNKRLHTDIFTFAGSVTRIGDEGNGWYMLIVNIPFKADQLKTD